MEKYKTKLAYQVSRTIDSPIFKHYYHPTIINKEFIPKEGPIILCGNHLHVWNQFPVIVSTKELLIGWQKKYFDGKMGQFFKMTGAICGDRGHDTSSATTMAENFLNMGSAIGIFPKVTRNGLKNEEIVNLHNLIIKKTPFDEFKESIRKINPRASQINILIKLYEEGQITKKNLEKTNNKLRNKVLKLTK